jgi:hypothetical protein
MKVEAIKQLDAGATASVDEDYGGYKLGVIIKQHNRRIFVLKTNAGTYSISIKSLLTSEGKRKIMRSYIHLTEEAMAGVIQAVISLDSKGERRCEMSPKDMGKYDLFYSARREQDSLSNIYPQENTAQVNTPYVDELYRRLDEADALRKENEELKAQNLLIRGDNADLLANADAYSFSISNIKYEYSAGGTTHGD